MVSQLVVFGPGYSAQPIMQKAQNQGFSIFTSYRNPEKRQPLSASGYQPFPFEQGDIPAIDASRPLHLLVTIAPKTNRDPTLQNWESWLEQQNIASLHYLSSTNVYGDRKGAWVDENDKPAPSLDRGKRRLIAEQEWQAFAHAVGARCFIYRLAGIYGPRRNAFCNLKAGRARCIIKEGQVFSRIHRSDICHSVWTALQGNHAGGIFNLADDMPTPPHEVVEYAATLMNIAPPTRENWDAAEMSDMARSFYLESKRVKNNKVKQELGIQLLYPNYKAGLDELYAIDGKEIRPQ